MAESTGDVLEQSGTGFEMGQFGGHVGGWGHVVGGSVVDCVALVGRVKTGVAVPGRELGCLILRNADTR